MGKEAGMTVYMAVTDDEYELPIAVAYTTQELEKNAGAGQAGGL